MKYIAKFIDYIDESTFIGIIALALFILVGSTFSNFLVTSNDHRATQMYIGELKYSLKVDNNNSNEVSKVGSYRREQIDNYGFVSVSGLAAVIGLVVLVLTIVISIGA